MFLVFLACSEEKTKTMVSFQEQKDSTTQNEVSTIGTLIDSLDIYEERALIYGDTAAYNGLRTIALEVVKPCLFFWGLTMANKYDYPPAYTDVFKGLLESNGYYNPVDIDCLDIKTREFALKYLKEGAKKGDLEAIAILDSLKRAKIGKKD